MIDLLLRTATGTAGLLLLVLSAQLWSLDWWGSGLAATCGGCALACAVFWRELEW